MEEVADPTVVRERIDAALEELENLSSSERSRKEIIDELSKDLSEYYGYLPELTELLLGLFSPAECVQYMEASERPRPLVIRTNTLKTNRKELMETLNKRGAAVEAVDWSKVAIKVTESSVPIGATPEYLAGHYMLQSASSLNPVMALAPVPGEKVLDMSAAPGGKTTYIAQLMKNTGFIVANDLKAQRQKATVANLHRLGVKNAVVCCHDGRKIGTTFKGFDRVLLDAPCSGMGIISRDPSVKVQRTVKDIERMAHLQKELLRAAIDVVDPNSPTGGYIVYSTCSVTVEENEQVVQYILSKRFVKLVDTGLQVGKPGLTRYQERRFHPSMKLVRRFYPHVHNMDGFFVAKFKKYANGERGDDDENNNSNDEGDGNYSDDEGDEEEEEDNGEDNESEESEEVPPPKKTSNNKKEQISNSKQEKEAPVAGKRKGTEVVAEKETADIKKSKSSKVEIVDEKTSGKKPSKQVVEEEEEEDDEDSEVDNDDDDDIEDDLEREVTFRPRTIQGLRMAMMIKKARESSSKK